MASSPAGVYLAGGEDNADGLWELRGREWTQVAAGGPVQRMMTAAAFDTRRNVLVIFGGVGGRSGSRFGDTWEWNGRRWTERVEKSPGPRDHHAMAYDEARGRVVLYGGSGPDGKGKTDTWTWDGATWAMAEATSAPGDLFHHSMAYDRRRQRVVMFGGIRNDGSHTDGSVWEWDGASWIRIPPVANGPGDLSHTKMAYDDEQQVIVMAGGGVPGQGGHPSDDTWTWNGAEWRRFANGSAGPTARSLHGLAYDPALKRIVMFGGMLGVRPYSKLGDAWIWNGAAWTPLASR